MNSRTKRGWLVRGVLAGALLVPLVLWLSGCWLFNAVPVAAFTISAQTGQAPFTINFSAVLSSDEDGVIVKFEWDFGDGTSGTGEAIAHTYDTAGTYTVVLRITDDGGESATAQKTIYILPGDPAGPAASFTASPTSGTSPLTVNVNAAASTYEGGTITSYAWDWGDGRTGYGQSTSHSYFSTGSQTFTITLTITTNDGRAATATRSVSVTAAGGGTTPAPAGAPSARFDIVDNAAAAGGPAGTTGVAPYKAQFDPSDTEVAVGKTLLQIVWSYGDSGSASSATLLPQWHTYATEDPSEVFSVTLLAMDNAAATDTITKTVKVYNHQPIAGFEIANPTGGHTDLDQPVGVTNEEYTNRADAVAAGLLVPSRWDYDEDNDGVVMGDLQYQAGTVWVWIRSRLTTDADWFDIALPAAPNHYNQDRIMMAEGVLAAPGTTPGVPDDYTGDLKTHKAFSYDPEGQSWADTSLPIPPGAADAIITNDYPNWFTNQAWGIQTIYVNWGDGPEIGYDYRFETDSSGAWALPARPAYDQDFVVGHQYAYPGGTMQRTITIRVVDFLGGQSTFSRIVHFQSLTEGADDL